MALKLPPQNLEAEKAVIGAILIDSEAVNRVMDIVQSKDFYDPRHELIFSVIESLFNANKPIDVLTVTGELKSKNKLKQSGGSSYLAEIAADVPTSANVKHYAEIVQEKAVRRRLITFSGQLDEKARAEDVELDVILDELEGSVVGLSSESGGHDFYDAGTLLEMQMKRADEFAKNPDGLRGHGTGFRDVDRILGGLHSSDLIILAARPSVGKSAFSIDIARHIAIHENKTVAFFALEMPAVQIMERMLAQQLQVNLWNIRMGKLSDDEFRKYSEGAGKISESQLFIDDTSGITINQLRSKVRKLALEKGIDFVVVDYLQLMQTRDLDNRSQAIGEISRSLKILARELNIPIMALSQLNRAVENRADNTPQLSDLRESGAIEQDADVVMFLSREMNLDDEDEMELQKIDLTIAKHRNGAIGRVHLEFEGAKQKFRDM